MKKKGTTECDKSIVTYDICNAQCKDGTIKCEKKKWGNHQMWQKYSHMWCNVRIVLSNVRNNKGIIECDKSSVTCDVGTAQCENGTIKCEKKK